MTERGMTERARKGPSERANHRWQAISAVLGGVIAVATTLPVLRGHRPGTPPPSLVTAPLPAWLAVAVALIWGVVLPIICWRWHRVVDEHERAAYRDGAVAGFYVVGAAAPVWYWLWRGGLAPPVDAITLYVATVAVTGVVWLVRKYA